MIVATAVQYAHEKGVIHRDLTPGNILLKKSVEAGVESRESENNGSPDSAPYFHPMITDFGLAKRFHSDGDLTATGQILGTPSYLPPEQAAGQIDQVRETADVYSLGAVLYAALTGRPPFQADNPVESLRQVLEWEPVSPRRVNPSVDKNLETICLCCLRKDPGSRYSSAKELAADLQRTLKNEPINARPVSRVEKTWLWCRRKPAVAAAVTATVAAILLITIIATSIVTKQQIANASRIARERKENDRKRAESLVENTLTAPAT